MHRPSLAPQQTARVIEEEKENIIPLQGGRPVTKLAKTLVTTRNLSLDGLKTKLQHERNQFEQELKDFEELDDPLQVYLNYIDWTHRNFLQGASSSSGLFSLLERCASKFRDVPHYKNDSRYLKVWLEYIEYHDTPRDAYIYLATKGIGTKLARFYEEFAHHLELKNKYADANCVYEIGIQNSAFPLGRLERSFQNFRERLSARNVSVLSPSEDIRRALDLKQGRRIESESEMKPIKRSKIDVFQDNAETDLNSIQSAFENENTLDQPLESRRSRVKENTIAPTRWSGQILPQKNIGPVVASEKLQIYCDDSSNTAIIQIEDTGTHRLIQSCKDSRHVYTLIEAPGKRPEKVMLNMELLYSNVDSEISSVELLAMQRRTLQTRESETKHDKKTTPSSNREIDAGNFTLPTMDDTTKLAPKDPTVTMYSKMAKNEVFDIFNQASQSCDQNGFTDTRIDDPTITNFDGFVTETMHPQMKAVQQKQEPLIPTQVDEPHTHAHAIDHVSSPFRFHPSSKEGAGEHNTKITDPYNADIRRGILQNLVIPLTTYPGYSDKTGKNANQFFKILDSFDSFNSQSSSHSMIIRCLEDEMYSLLSCLKRQERSLVCLVESESGCLKVLKIQRPATSWEYFILCRIQRRLLKYFSHEKQFVRAEKFYSFSDESYLVLEHYPQGNLLDVVNTYETKGKPIDECLAMFLSIRLLQATEALHGMDIIHGKISLENCMINFAKCEDRNFSKNFNRNGRNGWDKKQLTLINFNESIDLTEFPKGTVFSSFNDQLDTNFMTWMTANSWTFEIDYFGLANSIHILLFNECLQLTEVDGKTRLRRSLSRFWQPVLWQKLFNDLLNPTSKTGHEPNTLKLRKTREKLEEWLEDYAEAGNLKSAIISLEKEMGLA